MENSENNINININNNEALYNALENVPDSVQSVFIVRQGRFEGPYMKLLEMIENRKLSISEISLSQIADDYIEYVKQLKNNNNDISHEDMSQFIFIASTLMLIKAKSLLPEIALEISEEKEISQLEHKLELLKLLKLAESKIKANWGNNILLNRKRIEIKERVFNEPDNLTVENLQSVLLLTLAKMPNFERLRNVAVRQAIRLEDVIGKLMERLADKITSLKDFASQMSNGQNKDEIKKNIIVGFLAILELLKQNIITARENGDDIEISRV